jgi:IS5 family transposase
LNFLDEINRVVPWAELVMLIEQHCPRTLTERPQVPIETTLCIYFMHD